ncbi:MAG: membrane protein insertion efficiency factor YidD [Desulfitobacterium hafniense]|nr:membrane protein insertion efficiency factor YidD [Desulfitobacterium hafniense]
MKFKTESVMVIGADMPAYRMILILLAYTFMRQSKIKAEEENVITRPKVRVFLPFISGLVYFFGGIALFYLIHNKNIGTYIAQLFLVQLYYLAIIYLVRKKIVIWLIRLYQLRAPADVRAKCVLKPSCSDYMILAINKFGLISGIGKGIDRLRRCGPPEQIDYP